MCGTFGSSLPRQGGTAEPARGRGVGDVCWRSSLTSKTRALQLAEARQFRPVEASKLETTCILPDGRRSIFSTFSTPTENPGSLSENLSTTKRF